MRLAAALFLLSSPLLPADLPTERDGRLMIEAESFSRQEKDAVRRWHVRRDGAPAGSASGHAYVQALPDTRRTHQDRLVKGENFSDEPGAMAVLHYRVRFTTPGRYAVWASAWSSGSEDNSLHVGLDGAWPESGRRLQWCEGKHGWRWESRQRTAQQHCGVPGLIWLDVDWAGERTLMVSMREDGFAFDRIWLSRHPGDRPDR